jgi:hypothetical protein
MFRDFYRMADELHKAVEPIKERRRAAWDTFWAQLIRRVESKPVVWEYSFTIKVEGKAHDRIP